MKQNKNKTTVLAMFCLYLAVGMAALFVYYLYGAELGTDTKNIDYTFEDNKEAGEEIEVATVDIAEEVKPVEEPAAEPVVEAAPEETKKFYSFTVATEVNRLRIRREPNEEAKILGNFPKNATGYILVKGNEWSYVTDGKKTGYCFNEYLQMTEVSMEELPDFYPEEYKTESSDEINY